MTSTSNKKNIKNEWIRWIEDGIAKDYINYYDYDEFQNLKCIGTGGSSIVYQASWECSDTVVALKSLKNGTNFTKEIVNEVHIYVFEAMIIMFSILTLIVRDVHISFLDKFIEQS